MEGEGYGGGGELGGHVPPPPSCLYDPSHPQSFVRGCIQVLGRLGRGSFRELYQVLGV